MSVEFFDVLENRRSVRSFKPKPVPQEDIERVLAAAAAAPSAWNTQPWRFFVTTGESRRVVGEIVARSTAFLQEYIELHGPEIYELAMQWYTSLGEAPVVIVCTADEVKSDHDRVNVHMAVGAAVENLMLAATALGLGTCNVTFAHVERDAIIEALGIPAGREVVSLVALGYPTDEQPPAPPHGSDVADYLD
jgi:nitroreductase